jgi:Ca2+-dependent lipid-binding protein
MGILKIRLVKASNLADKDFFGKTDPYVKLELEQDNYILDRDFGYQISSTKKNELNPVWNEDFQFGNVETLENMVLTLRVFDKDIGSRDDKCGYCKIQLWKEGLTRSPKRIEKTVDRKLLKKNATIVVEVSYQSNYMQ